MRTIFPIIFVLLAGGLSFFVAKPIYSDITTLREDISAYDTALTHSTELQKVRDSLITTYKSITPADKDRLTKFLPNTVDNIQLILQLQQIATSHGMALKNIKFDALDTDKPKTEGTALVAVASNDPHALLPYGIFNLEFKTEAEYDTFASFIKDVEQNLRLVDIKAVSFDSKSKESDPLLGPSTAYEYNVKIQTYWLKH